jgi:very-short-patch-repair endonuclease
VATPLSAEWEAVLWAGEGAAISRASAGHVDRFHPKPPAVHVTAPVNRGPTEGLVVHRAALARGEIRLHDGLPVTTPQRTLLDLAADLDEFALEQALGEAQVRGLIDDRALRSAAAAARPGMPMLRGILDDTIGFTRSEAERMLRRLIRDSGLPAPTLNHEIADQEVDAFWPDRGLVLEFQGYGPHRTRKKFENDALKSAILAGLGLRVMYATWRRLRRRPTALIADLATALAHRRPHPSPLLNAAVLGP